MYQETLIGWAIEALGRWAGIRAEEWPVRVPADAADWLPKYGQLLSPTWALDGKGDHLQSVFSLVRAKGGQAAESAFVPARPLSADALLSSEGVMAAAIWQGFALDYERLPEGERRFDAFTHVFCKHAWAVPCTYGEAGVSLYEEFKALAALVHACQGSSAPTGSCLLVGGDIPGIQGFLYTLTSKGAAKGLRGRSFYLQLLGDAIVRALRRELGGLPEANVIYAAGGNFMLLAPAQSEESLQRWHKDFNRRLLDEYGGDLYLALGWEELPLSDVGSAAFAAVRERLGARVAAAKSRRFAENAGEWERLFQPEGLGGENYCQVCQREPLPGEELIADPPEAEKPVMKCQQCRGFEQLAYDIMPDPKKPSWMVVTDQPQQVEGWRGSLGRLTGFDYRFSKEPPETGERGMIYLLNDTDLGGKGAHGFRFIANVTPRIEESDRKQMAENHPDVEVPRGEQIKDFGMMALQSEGIARVGVLRMDVDNLGAIFSQHMRGSMAQVSALSAVLDLFFAGHLHHICAQVEEAGGHKNVLYVIYAGGDDLFVVGAWDRMPVLAEQIQEDFRVYTGRNPLLTISGGVTLEGRGFPLYRAAERAGETEGRAKRYTHPDGHEKDAFCFLDQTVGWGTEWKLIRDQKDNLLWLIGENGEGEEKRLSRALLQVVQSIHRLYADGLRSRRVEAHEKGFALSDSRMHFGRWMWMQVYSLARMVQRNRHEEVPGRVKELQDELLQPATIHLSGLAARWAEYLTRADERK